MNVSYLHRDPPAAPGSVAGGGADTRPAGRSRDIDGFRGFAALTVVVYHAWQFCRAGGEPDFHGTLAGRLLGGFDGMISWFFVTSAFLLYGPVVRRVWAGEDPGSARAFLLRRGLRVLPVYWVAILLVWSYRNNTLPGNWKDLLEHLTLTETFDSERIFYTIGPAWTLSSEVAFYLFVALIIAVIRRSGWYTKSAVTRRTLLVIPAVILLAGSVIYKIVALNDKVPFDRWAVWFNPGSFADNFALGMLLALVVTVRGGRPLTGARLRLLQLSAALITVGALFVSHGTSPSFIEFHELAAFGYTLLLACLVLAPPSTLWRKLLTWRPLVWVGTISFSLYVWHEPLLLFLDRQHLLSHDPAAFPAVAVTLTLAAVPLAWLAYHALELPTRNLNRLVGKDGHVRRYYPDSDDSHDPQPAHHASLG